MTSSALGQAQLQPAERRTAFQVAHVPPPAALAALLRIARFCAGTEPGALQLAQQKLIAGFLDQTQFESSSLGSFSYFFSSEDESEIKHNCTLVKY